MFQRMVDEWREEAREFMKELGYAKDYPLSEIEVDQWLDYMVEFAIKKASERGM